MKYAAAILCLAAYLQIPIMAQDQPKTDKPDPETELKAKIEKAVAANDLDQLIELTKGARKDTDLAELRAAAFHRRGVERFFAGKIKESIADFDAELKILPDRDPHHWQRGLCYYYAEEYEKGVAQFERHQTVNTQDVENAVWHFICAVRAPEGTVEKARKDFIDIQRDGRVPMKEVHALFAGTGSAEDVLQAANAGPESAKRNQLCYAHLYLGLYFEALGEMEKARDHMVKSAVDYKMDHYMGKTSQVHAKLRGWVDEKSEAKTE
ncbi:MAG: hypothetical protein HKN23_13450 [Verrucomicrobiales bacterium]|nr:hypothetical protein [Verrucomicrobiales bacterium]